MSRSIHLLSIVLLSLLAGCALWFGNTPPLASQVIYNGLQCGADRAAPTVQWINDPATLARRYSTIRASGDAAATTPPIDFKNQGVLLVTMGRRPSAGYRLNFLRSDWVRRSGSTVRVKLTWQSPEPGSEQAQVVTHPCLLLRLPAIAFTRVRVIDQDGTVRLNTGRNASRAAGS